MPTMSPARTFASLGVPAPLEAALATDGITAPFPIQTATLPDTLAGRDVLGRGRTGSGKTLAFAIPLVARLLANPRRPRPGTPRALVLVPTRELANQVAATIAPLAKAARLRHTVVYGGVGFGNQVAAMKAGVDIVVACPGRLEDLIGQHHCRLDQIEITVLDEADHMADMGFLPGVKRLMDRTPADGQRLLFSATLDRDVQVLVDRYLHDPITHALDPEDSPVDAMTHHLVETPLVDKLAVVTRLAAGHDRTLLFTRTKHGAKKLVKQLGQQGVPAVELHGNLSQNARERNLAEFTEGNVTVLVATDIAARGIHVDDVRLVVHVDPPAEHKAFLHRSGRTARAGADGVVVTVMTPEQRKDVRDMTRKAGIRPIVTAGVGAAHPLLEELAGPKAPHRTVHIHRPTQPQGQRQAQGQRQQQGQQQARGQQRQRQDDGRPAGATGRGSSTQQDRGGRAGSPAPAPAGRSRRRSRPRQRPTSR